MNNEKDDKCVNVESGDVKHRVANSNLNSGERKREKGKGGTQALS